jgi:hypothetical protein
MIELPDVENGNSYEKTCRTSEIYTTKNPNNIFFVLKRKTLKIMFVIRILSQQFHKDKRKRNNWLALSWLLSLRTRSKQLRYLTIPFTDSSNGFYRSSHDVVLQRIRKDNFTNPS